MNKSIYHIANIDDNKVQGYPTGMTFRNSKEGWITCSNHGQDYIPVFKTEDGGIHWNRTGFTIPNKYKADYYSNAFPAIFFGYNKQTGVILLQFAKDEDRPFLPYTTNTGGKTWLLPQDFISLHFTCYDFLDEKHWWAVDGKEGWLYKTNDSGKSWIRIFQFEFPNTKSVDFITEQTGWIISDKGLYMTSDNGITWEKQNMSINLASTSPPK